MDSLKIEIVSSRHQMRKFLNLFNSIYCDDSLQVKPLNLIERDEYSSRKNAVLSRSEHAFLLASVNGKPAGRMLVYIDPRYNSFHRCRTGFFGSFESIEDEDVSCALFRKAEEWFRAREMDSIMGPINPVAESWGFLLKGESPPVFMSPHNPLYYNSLAEAAGYEKAKDLVVYEADGGRGYTIPERFTRFSDTLLERKPELTVRRINRRKLMSEARHILRILNDSVAGNWGFVPVHEDEMAGIMKQLKMILDPDALWFVEDDGFPIGVALGFPDINVLIQPMKGRLTPAGLWNFITGRKKIQDFRLWGLAVLPEYHGLGLDVLLYVSLFRALEPRGIRLEANYMLEDNSKILNALEKMNLKRIKTYRVYSKILKR